MLELNKILVIIETGTDYQPALEKAVQLAKYANSELELLIADYSHYLADGYYFDPIEAARLRKALAEQHKKELESLASPLRNQGMKVDIATLWGNPRYEQITEFVKQKNPSLVIKSTRQHKKLARLFLSNEEWDLVRHCPAPLLLVKGRRWCSSPVFIASVDPGHTHDKPAALDHDLIEAAKSLAAVAGGSVHLFNSTWVPPLSGLYPLMMDVPELDSKLTELAHEHEISAQSCHASSREIEQSLPALADKLAASAVVMGAVSRSRLDRLFIGNTAEKVLDYLECDVLVVKL